VRASATNGLVPTKLENPTPSKMPAKEEKGDTGLLGESVALGLFFVFWYAGNVKYNEYNKGALSSLCDGEPAGCKGKEQGLTMTISTMQLGVCAAYAIVMWIIRLNPIKLCGLCGPEKQPVPALGFGDIMKTLPVGICSAGAHSSSVFALGGDPLFGQIVKAGEPVISAVVGTAVYNKSPSVPKWLCLPIIVGGVAFASMKKGAEGVVGLFGSPYVLKFDTTALVFGMIANGFAAFKGNENKKLMDGEMKKKFNGVGNQFAVTEILAFLVSLPVMFATEGANFGKFIELMKTNKNLQFNLIMSGMTFYLYNELATMTIKKTGAVTSSVANTAKRVIVMLYMAALPGASPLTEEQMIGAGIAIGGVMLYSVIDDLLKGKEKTK
jgi:solute carrier family 35 protein E1